jgi:hypothetical protein
MQYLLLQTSLSKNLLVAKLKSETKCARENDVHCSKDVWLLKYQLRVREICYLLLISYP